MGLVENLSQIIVKCYEIKQISIGNEG